MRVLHVTKKYPNCIGGDPNYVSNLEACQSAMGHQVFILTSRCREIIDKENVFKFGLKDQAKEWDKIGFKRLLSYLLLLFYLPCLLKKIKPDIIHAHSPELGFLVSLWSRFFKIPLVYTCHILLFPYKEESLIKRFLEFWFLKLSGYKKIITGDPVSLPELKRYFKNHFYMLPGVNLKIFKKKSPADENSAKKKIRFLFVGRLEKIKGVDILLQAAKMLKEKNREFEIHIVGGGLQTEELKTLAAKLGLNSFVSFLGPIADKEKLSATYSSSDVFVLPSIRDWTPVVVFEAWASSLAVIATSTSGTIAKVSRHLENILIVPPADPGALVDAMLKLMEDRSLRQRLGVNGRQFAESEVSWEVVGKKITDICQEVLSI